MVNDRHVIWNRCQIFYTKLPLSHRKNVTDALVCVVVVCVCVCVRIRCRKLVSDRDVYHRWALDSSAEDGEVYTLLPEGMEAGKID